MEPQIAVPLGVVVNLIRYLDLRPHGEVRPYIDALQTCLQRFEQQRKMAEAMQPQPAKPAAVDAPIPVAPLPPKDAKTSKTEAVFARQELKTNNGDGASKNK